MVAWDSTEALAMLSCANRLAISAASLASSVVKSSRATRSSSIKFAFSAVASTSASTSDASNARTSTARPLVISRSSPVRKCRSDSSAALRASARSALSPISASSVSSASALISASPAAVLCAASDASSWPSRVSLATRRSVTNSLLRDSSESLSSTSCSRAAMRFSRSLRRCSAAALSTSLRRKSDFR